jgi:hypothetical protein
LASFDSIMRDVLPYVPGCPDSVVENSLRSSSIELCEKAGVYTKELDPISTTAGIYEYEFDQPVGTKVDKIVWAIYDGTDLEAITPRGLEGQNPKWRSNTSTPKHFIQQSPDTFWLVPVPDSSLSNAIIMNVSLKPSRTSNNIATEIADDYRDAIVYGSLYRLLRMPARDWTDPAAAADYAGLFRQQVEEASIKARKANIGVSRKVTYGGVGVGANRRYRRYGSENG